MFLSKSLVKISDLVVDKPHIVVSVSFHETHLKVFTHMRTHIHKHMWLLSLGISVLASIMVFLISIQLLNPCFYSRFSHLKFFFLQRVLFSFKYDSLFSVSTGVCYHLTYWIICFYRMVILVQEMKNPGIDSRLRIDQIWELGKNGI